MSTITYTQLIHRLYTTYTQTIHNLYTDYTQLIHRLYTTYTPPTIISILCIGKFSFHEQHYVF
jgi:hypothetical protein